MLIYGMCLSFSGDPVAGLEVIAVGERGDPLLNDRTGSWLRGMAYYSERRYQDAIMALREMPDPLRSAALKALAEKWPDEATRTLFAERAVQDEDGIPRRAALKALADKWPDEATRALLAERAVQPRFFNLTKTAVFLYFLIIIGSPYPAALTT